MITMLISGGLAGMMAINVVMGEAERLVLDFVEGAGFVGIAVALMGRSHPVGVVLAALLFGALYQGGAELQFEMPAISREMVVVIQALVILFTGALDNMVRMPMQAVFLSLAPRPTGREPAEDPGEVSTDMDSLTILQILDSTVRLATPLLLACLAGLYSERAGVFDIGLEGKILASAFFSAAVAFTSGSVWIGLMAGIAASMVAGAFAWRRLHHLPRQPDSSRAWRSTFWPPV